MRATVYAILASMTLFGVGCDRNISRNGCSGCCQSGGHSDSGQMGRRGFDLGLGGHGRLGGGHMGHGHRGQDQMAQGQMAQGQMAQGQMAQGQMGHGHSDHSGRPSHVARLPHGYMQQQMNGPGGPTGPTVAYPYYTTRAPRDFLMANPPSIGP